MRHQKILTMESSMESAQSPPSRLKNDMGIEIRNLYSGKDHANPVQPPLLNRLILQN